MAQVRVKQLSFINNSLVPEGTVVEYDGELSDNLELVEEDKPKRAKKAAAPAADAQADGQQEQAGE